MTGGGAADTTNAALVQPANLPLPFPPQGGKLLRCARDKRLNDPYILARYLPRSNRYWPLARRTQHPPHPQHHGLLYKGVGACRHMRATSLLRLTLPDVPAARSSLLRLTVHISCVRLPPPLPQQRCITRHHACAAWIRGHVNAASSFKSLAGIIPKGKQSLHAV